MSKFKVMSELVEGKNIISHLFMNNIHNTKWFEQMPERRKNMTDQEIEEETVEITLNVNGEELTNTKEVFDNLENQLESLILLKATELVKKQTSNKFREISEKLSEFEQITNEWANDINWDYEYNAKHFKE